MHAGAFAMTPDSTAHRDRLVDPEAPESERTYALATHLSILAFLVIGIPVVVPLILWLIRRGDSPFLDDHGKEAVNFQISLLIYGLLSIVLMPVCFIGFVTISAAYVLGIVGCIMASIAARRGEFFRYPMTLRLIG
jgi:uncharacterized Tic20 family protein